VSTAPTTGDPARDLQGCFSKPAALMHLTESERQFVHDQFPGGRLLEDVIGVGVGRPAVQSYPRMPAQADNEPTAGDGAA